MYACFDKMRSNISSLALSVFVYSSTSLVSGKMPLMLIKHQPRISQYSYTSGRMETLDASGGGIEGYPMMNSKISRTRKTTVRSLTYGFRKTSTISGEAGLSN